MPLKKTAAKKILLQFLILSIALPSTAFAESDESSEAKDIVVVFKKVKKDFQKQKERRKELQHIITAPSIVYTDHAVRAETTAHQGDAAQEMTATAIEEAEILIQAAEKTDDLRVKQDLYEQAHGQIQVARMGLSSLRLDVKFGDWVYRAVEQSKMALAAGDFVSARSHAVQAFGGTGKDGGILLDRTAKIDLQRSEISRVEYETSSNRFVFHRRGANSVSSPAMDKDLVAAAIRCLYFAEKKSAISVSFGVHPVTGKVVTGPPNSEAVLLGCKELRHTDLGRILIESDDLLRMISMGKNLGENLLTRELGYHSQVHYMLDHPVSLAVIKNNLHIKNLDSIRTWISPARIRGRVVGDRLEFDDVSFSMFTETLKMDSATQFNGEMLPNLGADLFSVFFSDNFQQFANYPLRQDPSGPVRPFLELKKAAKIVGLLRWIKGGKDQAPLSMDLSWVRGYSIKRATTLNHLPYVDLVSIEDVEKEIIPPFTIYNQYGPSRKILTNGDVIRVHYDSNGKYSKITREKWAHR